MANSYTATIPSNVLHGSKRLSWNELHSARYAFDSTFQLDLEDGQVFYAEKVVRVIPRRRLVAFGTWQGKPVFVKLFFDTKRAKYHVEKDVAGIKALQEHNIPTPRLYYQCLSKDKRIQVLIFERIFNAQNLDEIWQAQENVYDILPLMQAVTVEIATQHVFGLMQEDLHLKNYLVANEMIYTLDGAEIKRHPEMLSKKVSMMNLAKFLSQMGVGLEKYKKELFYHYARARGWLVKNEDVNELFQYIREYDAFRWRRFGEKIVRECTDFSSIKKWDTVGMFDRSYAAPEMLAFLENPEMVFTHPTVQSLKLGRSSTVVKVTLDQRDYVVKRYNMKNILHWLRRCFRPSRAMHSWRLAQKLNLFGVATSKPIAFLEKRFLGLRARSYFMMEYVPGEHAGNYFMHHLEQEDKIAKMIERISALFKNLAKLDITHGDLKVTNILINTKEQPVLIDLDGAAEHSMLSSLRAVWRKEIKRFLANFHHQPTLKSKFKNELR